MRLSNKLFISISFFCLAFFVVWRYWIYLTKFAVPLKQEVIHKSVLFVHSASNSSSIGIITELVDVSDGGELGNKEVTIENAHIRGVYHRGSWMILFNENRTHIFFVRRSNATVICTNAWNSIGEHCHIGESYQAAMLRGLTEELNVVESDLLLFHPLGDLEFFSLNHRISNRLNRQWTQTYIGVVADGSIRLNPKEASAIRWVEAGSARDWIKSCDEDVDSGACIPRTCRDSNNITISNKASGLISRFDSYGELLASKIDMANKFLHS